MFFMANVPKVFQLRSDLLGHYWLLGVEAQFSTVKSMAKPEPDAPPPPPAAPPPHPSSHGSSGTPLASSP